MNDTSLYSPGKRPKSLSAIKGLHTYHYIPFLILSFIGLAPSSLQSETALWTVGSSLSLIYFLTIYPQLIHSKILKTLLFALVTVGLIVISPPPSLGILIISLAVIVTYSKKSTKISLSRDSFKAVQVKFSLFLGTTVALAQPLGFVPLNAFFIIALSLSLCSVLYILLFKTKFSQVLILILYFLIVSQFLLGLYLERLSDLLAHVHFEFFATAFFLMLRIWRENPEQNKNGPSLWETAFSHPEFVIIGYFSFFALIGTFLLSMPIATTLEHGISLIDALFTAMSAICVTGLIVLDTPQDFTLFGQAVILGLIQLGGIGIVSMSSWMIFILNSKRLSIQHEETISDLTGYKTFLTMKGTLLRILLYFLVCEVIGLLLLFPFFMNLHFENTTLALWKSVFTSISAFCNAGFALDSDSLVRLQTAPVFLFVISSLIILGGTAPLLVFNLPKQFFTKRFSLQDRIVLITTASLILFGLISFLLVEWNHSLSHLDLTDRLSNAWFQSVTTRTAGFNSLDYENLRPITLYIFMLLMFIGGNPGGAAGGIKTVTFAVIVIAAFSGLKGLSTLRTKHRNIPIEILFKSMTIICLGLISIFTVFFMLSVTQEIESLSLLFETVSALGTVGLSIGATGQLDVVGKIIITMAMLLGRVGPLTFIYLILKKKDNKKWELPFEKVYVS